MIDAGYLPKLSGWLCHAVYDAAQIGPIGVSFMDLWEKLLRSTPTDSVIRWAVTMQRFFLGNASEARNRSRQTIPSVAEYIAIRRNVSAVGPCIVSPPE